MPKRKAASTKGKRKKVKKEQNAKPPSKKRKSKTNDSRPKKKAKQEEDKVSRLERLFIMLTSKNKLIRTQAAEQLGQIQKAHPNGLQNLLTKVSKYLYSSDWETRISASLALKYIAQEVPQWKPESDYKGKDEEVDMGVFLDFDDFDINQVVKGGAALLSGEDYRIDWSKVKDPGKRLELQRAELKQKLGLDSKLDVENDLSHLLVEDSELEVKPKESKKKKSKKKGTDMIGEMESKKKGKRKSRKKKLTKAEREAMEETRKKQEEFHTRNALTVVEDALHNTSDYVFEGTPHWPFQQFCNSLWHNLFNDKWSIRHGAAAGLRAILQIHAGGGGGMSGLKSEELKKRQYAWINDCCCRLLCVFALDRYQDYTDDSAVAPTRETCGMVLGSILKHASIETVNLIFKAVQPLCENNDLWECRQGGFIVMKYVLAVRQDVVGKLPPSVLPSLVDGLEDDNDAIQAVVASAIEPIAQTLISESKSNPSLRTELWDLISGLWIILQTLDDLNSAVPDACRGLAEFYADASICKEQQNMEMTYPDLIELLLKLYQNTLRGVRQHSLHTTLSILKNCPSILEDTRVAGDLIVAIFAAMFAENDTPLLNTQLEVWNWLCDHVSHKIFERIIKRCLRILVTRLGQNLPEDLVAIRSKSADEITTSGTKKQQKEANAAQVFQMTWPKFEIGVNCLSKMMVPCLADAEVRDTFFNHMKALLEHDSSWRWQLAWSLLASLIEQTQDHNALILSKFDNLFKKHITVELRMLEGLPEFTSLHNDINFRAEIFLSTFQSKKHPNLHKDALPVKGSSLVMYKNLVADFFEEWKEKIAEPKDLSRLDCRQRLVEVCDKAAGKYKLYASRIGASASAVACLVGFKGVKISRMLSSLISGLQKVHVPELQKQYAKSIARIVQSTQKSAVRKKVCDKMKKLLVLEDANAVQGVVLFWRSVCAVFGSTLFASLPFLQKLYSSTLNSVQLELSDVLIQEVLKELKVLKAIIPLLDSSLLETGAWSLFPKLLLALGKENESLRVEAQNCIIELVNREQYRAVNEICTKLVPLTKDMTNDDIRLGAVECIARTLQASSVTRIIAPYLPFLVAPLLVRLSDHSTDIRRAASRGFASAVGLIPLEKGTPTPKDMLPTLAKERPERRKFLDQIIDGSLAEDFKSTVKFKAELRKYQQDGVNWLWFLHRYGLHGILCDDMGLGKTLQSLIIVANSHHEQEGKLPSLVVCPATIVIQWKHEIRKFFGENDLVPYCFLGSKENRKKVKEKIGKEKNQVFIVSYDVLTRNIDAFTAHRWDYLILDEGHLIKNAKAKKTRALKTLISRHRLILSGTPIQNNVVELWSLFDFLMPGFLGDESFFYRTFAKPIEGSRKARSDDKSQQEGAFMLESLHKQVLPFLLRRLKTDVLKDLPPKTIQHYFVELSPIQKHLYESFSKTQAAQKLSDGGSKTHVLAALTYMRKLCSHPKLVLTKDHARYKECMKMLKEQRHTIEDASISGKFATLQQILLDSGIADKDQHHRFLIFCQLRQTLDVVEQNFLKKIFPMVEYRVLHGGLDENQRFQAAQEFNNDPTIDILLMTTRAGGLGLNLTGADTVIFLEHDWNPAADSQAMDRCHRIGQTKRVHVYRLITKDTIEEKIMGVQKWKTHLANEVITDDNSSLKTMNTGRVLDLFKLGEESRGGGEAMVDEMGQVKKSKKKTAVQELMDQIVDLKDSYNEQFDMKNFLKELK